MPLIELTSDLSRKDNPQERQKILGRPSVTAIARDTERITKFLISPKGLLFTAKQFAQQLMNPNTENIAGKAGVGLTKIYDPLSPITNTAGAPLGLRTDRHMPPIVRATTSTYEGIINSREGDEKRNNNRLIRLKNELLSTSEDDSGPRKLLKKIQEISNTIQGFEGQVINTLSGLTGPQSVGGIGATTIRRYVNTSKEKQSELVSTHPKGYGVLNQKPVESNEDRINSLGFGGGDERSRLPGGQARINQYKQIMYGQIPDRSNQPSIASSIVRFDRLKENGSGNVKSYYDNESTRKSNFKKNTLRLIDTIDESVDESLINFSFDDIAFKAYIGQLSDNFAPSWDSTPDQGRADPRYQYSGFERTISFDFIVVAHNSDQLELIWNKLQKLAQLTHPVYGSEGFYGQSVNVTIGKLFDDRPMIIQDLGYDWDNETPWEIDEEYQSPLYTRVTMTCVILGDRPQSNSKLYDIKGLS